MLDRIPIPLDGSMLAESAMAKALDITNGRPAAFVLLRATEAHTLPGLDSTGSQIEVVREAEEYLAGIAARLRERGVEHVETSVWYGPAAPAITDAVRLRKIDMIAMGTHGRSGVGKP